MIRILALFYVFSFSYAQEISCAPYMFYRENDTIEVIINPVSAKFEPRVSKMKISGPLASSDWRFINIIEGKVARLSSFWSDKGVERLLGQSFTLIENSTKLWGVFVVSNSGKGTNRGIAVLSEENKVKCFMTSLPNWLRGTDKILSGYNIESQKIVLSDPEAAEKALGF